MTSPTPQTPHGSAPKPLWGIERKIPLKGAFVSSRTLAIMLWAMLLRSSCSCSHSWMRASIFNEGLHHGGEPKLSPQTQKPPRLKQAVRALPLLSHALLCKVILLLKFYANKKQPHSRVVPCASFNRILQLQRHLDALNICNVTLESPKPS